MSALLQIAINMQNGGIPPVKRLLETAEHSPEDEFMELVDTVLKNGNRSSLEQLMYYLVLFRDDAEIQSFINSPRLPLRILEGLVLYSQGYSLMKGDICDNVIERFFYFLNQESLLRLMTESKVIVRDHIMSIGVISRMTRQTMNRYFDCLTGVDELIESMLYLPPGMIRDVVLANSFLFENLMQFVYTHPDHPGVSQFQKNHGEEIDFISKVREVQVQLLRDENCKETCDSKINTRKIRILVDELKKTADPDRMLEYLFANGTFSSDFEYNLTAKIIKEPHLFHLS